jgi:hypothetical protein
VCKIGSIGPGGGTIFFVDYHDDFPGFNYLELAPAECEVNTGWSSNNTVSLTAASGWSARAVGAGQDNTTAMLTTTASYTGDGGGSARYADNLHYAPTTNLSAAECSAIRNEKSDWFLGSLGEMMLMWNNSQGLGNITWPSTPGALSATYYWTSTEYSATDAWVLGTWYGNQEPAGKADPYYVRPIRRF